MNLSPEMLAVLGAVALAAAVLAGRRYRWGKAPAISSLLLPEGSRDLGCLPLPFAGKRPLTRMLAAYLDPSATSFANAVRHARTRLVLDLVSHGRGVVVFHARACRDDSHWMATNLALALAQLGRVLLVTSPGAPALDDGSSPDDQARTDGSGTRTWAPGMIDLARWDGISAIDADIARRWRSEYEWLMFTTEGDSIAAVVRRFEGCALVRIAVPADAADLAALIGMGEDGAGQMTLGVLRVCDP